MREPTPELLSHVVAQVLADGAFVMTEPCHELAGPGEGLCFRIPFAGPHSGEITFEAPVDLGVEILSNLVDLDAITENGAKDALREMTNVIAGALMPELFAGEVIDLGIPSEVAVEPGPGCRAELLTDAGLRVAVTVAWGAAA